MKTNINIKTTWHSMIGLSRGTSSLKGSIKETATSSLNPENRAQWALLFLFVFFIICNGWILQTKELHYSADINHDVHSRANLVFPTVSKNLFREYLLKAENFEQIRSSPEFWELPLAVMDSIPSASPLKRNTFFLSSGYGLRKHPLKASKTRHKGVDLATEKGTPIFSSAAGTVIELGYEPKGYGYFVRLQHSFGFETLYGHLSEVVLKVSTEIRSQQLIGYSGNTGFSTGPHLHYEVIKNGKAIDPIPSFGMKYKMFEQRLRTLTN